MKCPLNGRRGWIHAYEHGDLSEDRGGAGDEVTGSVVTSHIGQDQVVAGIHQHLDTTLTLVIAGHRVGHYSAQGKLLTPLTKKQIKAVEKTLRGKVPKQTFPLNLQIPHTTRDSHFPTASASTG